MRTMKATLNLVIAVALAAGLTACGSKKGSSGKTASTPGSTCTYNPQYGYNTDSQGRYCNATNTTNCQSQGYTYYNGQWYNGNTVVTCNDGGNWGQNGYFPYQGYTNGGSYAYGCESWSYYYPGNQYVPISVGNGQMVCANVAYINSYYSGFQQQYNYYGSNYFNQYPMYWGSTYPSYGGGGYGGYNGCSTQIGVNFSTSNIGAGAYLCF